jgi:protein subunit release factor B
MTKFGVRPEKIGKLYSRMAAVGIREEDIEERFIRATGHGGQNLNKTSTCVQIRHIPSGIIVKSQRGRTQGLNRFLARRSLLEVFEVRLLGSESTKLKKNERIRKQKLRRRTRSKKKLELSSRVEKV